MTSDLDIDSRFKPWASPQKHFKRRASRIRSWPFQWDGSGFLIASARGDGNQSPIHLFI
jgi:hypothetical protein